DVDLKGHTDYKLCLLPLGGYVKIAGMVDESFDTEFASKEPEPFEFRAKPTYQKLFVITAGVLMNLLLAVVIYWGVNYFQGKQVMETTKIGAVADSSIGYKSGFRSYDEVNSINGTLVNDWEGLLTTLLIENMGNDVEVNVERNGEEFIFTAPKELLSKAAQQPRFFPIGETKTVISDVMKNSPAEDAGIKAEDIVVELNNKQIFASGDLIEIVTSNKNTDLPIKLIRGEDTMSTVVNPGMEGKIGVAFGDAYIGKVSYQEYGLGESLSRGISNVGTYTSLTLRMFGSIIKGDVAFEDNIGGPVKIAKFAAQSAELGITAFLLFLAMLSLSLAIINIMPFPVLDGGHFVIILIEGIIGKELPIKAKLAIQNVGFVILMALMVFIVYTDIASL
ncbi:MAG: RIP metalloprotease RseP, partial [Ignavibacteriae bacterium]|nr:RIP metalloprotease RseP [Ignavibacteriota bacterium]